MMAPMEPQTERQADRFAARLTEWVQSHPMPVAILAVVGLVASVAMGVALAVGGDQPPTPTTPTTTPTETVPPVTEPADPGGGDYSYPELGLVAVKVDNAAAARPQVGLDAARYLLEVPVEGGITRFLAFFEPGDTLVGPVRSIRPVDVDLVPAFSEILVSTGGRPFVTGEMVGNGVIMVGGDPFDSPLEVRERAAPHNLFVNLVNVPAPAPRPVALPRGDFPAGGTPTESFEVPYPTVVTWQFSQGVYTRLDGGSPTVVLPSWDGAPVPLAVDTVVVMLVNQRSAGYTDVNGIEVPAFDVIGSGRAIVHHGGTAVEGFWSRSSLADPYLFRSTDGSPFGFPEGRVFVHVVPRP